MGAQTFPSPTLRVLLLIPVLLFLVPAVYLFIALSNDSIQVPEVLTPVLEPLRKLFSPEQCQLGSLCTPSQTRSNLPSGKASNPVWDLPRHLMASDFRDVQRIVPNAKVNYIWKEPLVVYFDDVLSEEELNLIVDFATPRFKKSMVVGKDGTAQEDTSRTSDTAWLYTSDSPKIEAIVQKVASLAGFTAAHSEPIGVNRYRSSQYFNPHFDFLQEDQLHAPGEFVRCQRASTILIYLSDVEEGGESVFVRKGDIDGRFDYDENNPDHLAVKPKRGRVLIWYDMHPYTEEVDHRTLHGGSPVKQGTKLAATVFIRNCTRTPQNPGGVKQEL